MFNVAIKPAINLNTNINFGEKSLSGSLYDIFVI